MYTEGSLSEKNVMRFLLCIITYMNISGYCKSFVLQENESGNFRYAKIIGKDIK